MIANFPVWGKAQRLPKFEYTGNYEYIDDGGGNWRIKFLTSGVFTPLKEMVIDAFLVGGGGGSPGKKHGWASGGGGGYTRTDVGITLTANTQYQIEIGAGGVNASGGDTSAFGNTAKGGRPGEAGTTNPQDGGNGGSGGGQKSARDVYDGGSDGSDGGKDPYSSGGKGQGTTTREFGEADGTLYAGGGGAYTLSKAGKGGLGGGADGGTSALDNTGGGAGGGTDVATSGGSGIVVIRNTRVA